MSDVDEEEFMCGDDEEYDLVNCTFAVTYIFSSALCCAVWVVDGVYSTPGIDRGRIKCEVRNWM